MLADTLKIILWELLFLRVRVSLSLCSSKCSDFNDSCIVHYDKLAIYYCTLRWLNRIVLNKIVGGLFGANI